MIGEDRSRDSELDLGSALLPRHTERCRGQWWDAELAQ